MIFGHIKRVYGKVAVSFEDQVKVPIVFEDGKQAVEF
jgi:hypothetical protein